MIAFVLSILGALLVPFILWSTRKIYKAVMHLVQVVKEAEGKNSRDHQRAINAIGLVEGQIVAHRREFDSYVKQHEGRHDTIDAILRSNR